MFPLSKQLLVNAIVLVLAHGQAAFALTDGDQKPIVVQWSGGNGDINREIAFRADKLIDWISLWHGLRHETEAPIIDFSNYEAIGIILPKESAPLRISFESHFMESDTSIVLTYRIELTSLSKGPMTGSRYAIAVIPKTKKTIFLRTASADVERQLLDAREIRVGSLIETQANTLPSMPLVHGGHASLGSIGFNGAPSSILEVFTASALFVEQDAPEYRLAHVQIVPDVALRAVLSSTVSNSPGSDPFISVNEYIFNTDEGEFILNVRIDGRQQTLEVDFQEFDLREGNFVRIQIKPDRTLNIEQIPVVHAHMKDQPSDYSEEIKQVFDGGQIDDNSP